MDDDIFRKMRETAESPEIQGCLAAIEAIAGFKLSAYERQPFLYLHNYITAPQPLFITVWRSDPLLEKWYHKFTSGFLDEVQNTLACVLYHHGRLKSLEVSVIENIERFDYRRILGDSTIGLGNTLIWDFEYQAFVLAFRRCLDYLTRAICAYFKNDFHSFRKLGKFLENRKPENISGGLTIIHEKYSPLFEFVLSDGNRKSLRDKISHYEYVPAGVINLSRRGFILAGGGEKLGMGNSTNSFLLSEVLDKHVSNLRGCIRDIIFQLVNSLRMYEPK